MTNREAIERIKDHMRVHKIGEYPHVQTAEALRMAIDALNPVPSRQEIEWLRKLRISILDGKCKIAVTLPDGASSKTLDTYAGEVVARYTEIETQRHIDRLYEIIDELRDHPRSNWKPCDKEMPTEDGFYMATIRVDNALQHGEYESRVEFDRGHWCQISSDMKVTAWRKESPYRADQFREPTEMMQENEIGPRGKMHKPLKPCCGEQPLLLYIESAIGLSPAYYMIKCRKCHGGVEVDVSDTSDEGDAAAMHHAVDLWNVTYQHKPPMNTEICLPRMEEAE